MKVLTSNYQAEFGRNAGGSVQVVTKSGTQEFHGSGWWTHRHEGFNANDFFNNITGLPRSRYRFNIAGWSLGGPVFVPKHFNVGKTKVFFFASQEYTQQLATFGNQFRSMPTLLERNGDFSKSVTGANALIPVLDPLNLNAAGAATLLGTCSNRISGWDRLRLLPSEYHVRPNEAEYCKTISRAGSAAHPRRNDIHRSD